MKAKARKAAPLRVFLTDERLGAAAAEIISGLPRDVVLILRDYRRPDRIAWGRRMLALAHRRGLTVLWAGTCRDALRVGADGVHLQDRPHPPTRRPKRDFLVTAAAHDAASLRRAGRVADMALLSPVFPTGSHPGGPVLGTLRFGLLARGARLPIIALGGMTPSRFRRLAPSGARGFAAIDYWSGGRA